MFPVWAWVAFGAFVLLMLVLDLFVLHRDAKEISFREAAVLSAFWVALAFLFGIFVWIWAGPTTAGEYYAGYIIEKALSVDNVFVFALIFACFAVPVQYQYRVLFWGVLGALVLRVIFILIGAELLEAYDWMVYLFGAFLIYTGIRMARHSNQEVHPERNPVLRLLRRVLPMTDGYRGQKLLVRERGKLMATPLLAVLIAVETTDVVFAVDSIPAIFAITTNTFVVWTSNAFAILGLRALYCHARRFDAALRVPEPRALDGTRLRRGEVHLERFVREGADLGLPTVHRNGCVYLHSRLVMEDPW
jgi:tellurite resistance protein TerC